MTSRRYRREVIAQSLQRLIWRSPQCGPRVGLNDQCPTRLVPIASPEFLAILHVGLGLTGVKGHGDLGEV